MVNEPLKFYCNCQTGSSLLLAPVLLLLYKLFQFVKVSSGLFCDGINELILVLQRKKEKKNRDLDGWLVDLGLTAL